MSPSSRNNGTGHTVSNIPFDKLYILLALAAQSSNLVRAVRTRRSMSLRRIRVQLRVPIMNKISLGFSSEVFFETAFFFNLCRIIICNNKLAVRPVRFSTREAVSVKPIYSFIHYIFAHKHELFFKNEHDGRGRQTVY